MLGNSSFSRANLDRIISDLCDSPLPFVDIELVGVRKTMINNSKSLSSMVSCTNGFFLLPTQETVPIFQITLKADHIICSSFKAETSEHRTRTRFITPTDVEIPVRSAMVKESSGVLVHGDQSILTYIKFLGAETGWIFRGGESRHDTKMMGFLSCSCRS